MKCSRTVSCISMKRFNRVWHRNGQLLELSFTGNAQEGHAATYVVLSEPSDLVTVEHRFNVQYLITIKTF